MKSLELALRPEEAASETSIGASIRRQLELDSSDPLHFKVVKRSIDARSRTVLVRLQVEYSLNEILEPEKTDKRNWQNVTGAEPVAIIGCGPAGLFAAIRLIELGLKPVIIERGKKVRERRRDLAMINREGLVHEDSNYCFGEGGAGTYSDGKLFTRSLKRGNVRKILHTFIEMGAHPGIAVDAHPHIGTNKLPGIIENFRERINECGGEFHFESRFKSFERISGNISGIRMKSTVNGSETHLKVKAVILATGHSARDIFEYFDRENLAIEAKPFALGVRIEHPQAIIDAAQYHCTTRDPFLPPASYSLVSQQLNRGVYSFCMCPGGIIAPAATAPGEIVVNGWSPSKRNNPFANSGVVVSIESEDLNKYKKAGELSALRLQQEIEKRSYEMGGGKLVAPAQRMTDFINRKISASLPKCSYRPGVHSADLFGVLPKEVSESLALGLKDFGKKMKGYLTNEAILVAVESRTSSPVRIPRDPVTLMHKGTEGLFPCGEGAGYAGGIASAAMDGEKCADGVANYLKIKNLA